MTNETLTAPSSTDKKIATRETRVVVDQGPLANLFDTARFEHMHRIATVMAGASLIPDHMWKDKSGPLEPAMVQANCFLVVNQSVRWGFDPFAVVPCTYVVGGKLGFEGKLVAAVINARANLKHNLSYSFSGTKGKDDFTVTVSGTLEGEDEPRTITMSVGEAKTDNKMWTRDPEQKLVYSGATKWARRHCPEIILGVTTDDDLERMGESQGFDHAKQVNEPVRPAFKRKLEPETLQIESATLPPNTKEAGSSQVTQPLDRGNAVGSESTGASNAAAPKTSGGSKSKRDDVAPSGGGSTAPVASDIKPSSAAAPAGEASPFADKPVSTDLGGKHEVAKKPGSEALSTTSAQPVQAALLPASAEDESQDQSGPLLKKIRDAMKSYDIPEDKVLSWAKEQAILPKRSSLSLDDLSDNILGLMVNSIDNLVKPYAEGVQ